MKLFKSGLVVPAAMVLALAAGALAAQESAVLARSQWLKKIGESVASESVLRETLAQVSPDDKVEFTQRILKAVTRMPVSPEEKTAAFVRAAVATIGSVKGDLKSKVIAENFAGIPVEHLPVVTEELAKRFDQEYNKLSDEQYEKIASDVLREAVARNEKTDAPSVRNTFVMLAFLRGAKNPQLQDKLLALLPDDRMRDLAKSWLPPALKDRNYDALLAAADVEPLPMSFETILRLVGHGNLDRLLADLASGVPLSSLAEADFNTRTSVGFVEPTDFGVNRRPQYFYTTGYQNQGFSIKSRGRGYVIECCCPCPPAGAANSQAK